MAVYTNLGAEALSELTSHYDVGRLVSAKGIAEGVSNSNWLIETDGGEKRARRQFILTMYERRIDIAELPYFLDLLDHLAAAGSPVPRTIHDRTGATHRAIDGKAVALIEFLPGISPDKPTKEQLFAVGEALAGIHLAAQSFPGHRENRLGPSEWVETLARCGEDRLAEINPDLPRTLDVARQVKEEWPTDLPRSVIHSDLFPDNVLMVGDRVSGLIDFYFACNDMMAYDLAVIHAAWCFDESGNVFNKELGRALVAGYDSRRALSDEERRALPLLAKGACLRFVASRAFDWFDTGAEAMVTRKDPMQFARRLDFYEKADNSLFTPPAA
ncbi:homoserine kinase [Altererythrobacter aurantiacus]|uniref:Homoserine kinase n=1 Tax=Parapontixanthobacter aurantiacus TaxID=1463599 RepID=A0A844ZBU5_9SPHN|nr:homoserine kinase [Parapontixanthobacter aurantiacus]MXO84656.1 homoserine kinase [Parapontixanthobacter aurantiacus]